MNHQFVTQFDQFESTKNVDDKNLSLRKLTKLETLSNPVRIIILTIE